MYPMGSKVHRAAPTVAHPGNNVTGPVSNWVKFNKPPFEHTALPARTIVRTVPEGA